MGSIGPSELIVMLVVLVPMLLVVCSVPFFLGYVVGKGRGQREAQLERLSRGRFVGGGMVGSVQDGPNVDPGNDRPRNG